MKLGITFITFILLAAFTTPAYCVYSDLRSSENEYIQIVDSKLLKDDDLMYVDVNIIFKKRAIGRTLSDKPRDIFTPFRRYGKMPDSAKVYYFDSDYHFKVFVDLFDDENNLIRTDSAYYDEYRDFISSKEKIEVLPGETKTITFGVPKSVKTIKCWVTNELVAAGIAYTVNAGQANANEEKEIEQILRIANQQARCMDAILESFPSKQEEEIAYSKFYKALVKHHRKFIEYTLKHEGSDWSKIVDHVGSKDILVGMVMQSTITIADEYNAKYDKERVGKTLSEFDKFLWNVNGCDAIYSSM